MGVRFLKKNKMDLDFTDASITVTDVIADDNGQSYVNFLRNRDNTSGWMTTNSTDAANTTLVFDLGSGKDVDTILLINNNFKAYTIKYWDDLLLTWVNFSPAINVSGNTNDVQLHEATPVNTSKLQLIITAAFTLNADKKMTQFIATETLGELNCQPVLSPKIDRSRKTTNFLSGKAFIPKSVASYELKIAMAGIVNESDLDLAEVLFASYEDFLVWPSGGTITQFTVGGVRQSYGLQDIYLMNMATEYFPTYGEGRWLNGVPINFSLQEVN